MEIERALVIEPDSIGVRIRGEDEWTELHLILYRGGWADLDTLITDGAITEYAPISTPTEFGALLDTAVMRLLSDARPDVTT